jgi:hypothetical protein
MQLGILYLIPVHIVRFDHGNINRFIQILNHINSISKNVTILIWNPLFKEDDFENLKNLFLNYCTNLILVYGKDLDQVTSDSGLLTADFVNDSSIIDQWYKSRKVLVGDRGLEIENKYISPKVISILHQLSRTNLVSEVITNYFFTGGLLDIFGRKVKKTIDLHDIFSRKSRLFYTQNESSLIKNNEIATMPGHRNNFVTSIDLEIAFLNSADELISISQVEFDIVSSYLPAKSNVLIPYVSNTSNELVKFRYSGLSNFSLIMSDNFFNRKDLIFFLKSVWLYVENRDVQLNVIGGISKFAGTLPFSNVINCGTYEDDKELQNILLNTHTDALLFINRFGSGQKVKFKYFDYLRLPKIFFSSKFDRDINVDNFTLICNSRDEFIDILSIGKISV